MSNLSAKNVPVVKSARISTANHMIRVRTSEDLVIDEASLASGSKFPTIPSPVAEEPNYADELVLYFYSELLKYVVVEYNGVSTKEKDSDEEPPQTGESQPRESDAELIRTPSKHSKKSKTVKASMSKLLARRQTTESQGLGSTANGYEERYSTNKKTSRSLYSSTTASYGPRPTNASEDYFRPKDIPNLSKTKELKKKPDSEEFPPPSAKPSVVSESVGKEPNFSFTQLSNVPSDDSQQWMVKANMNREHVELKFSTGVIYRGEMLRNRFDGNGLYKWPDGTSYEGEFSQGYITGFGKLIYNNLSYYQGKFINCIPEGVGAFSPATESMLYSGNWRYGTPHGEGRLQYKDKDYYSGNWCFGMKSGHGTRVYESGTIYSGNWYEGRQNGEGSMIFYNKDFYQGEWINGLPNGYGEYTWASKLNEGTTCTIEKQYFGNFSGGGRDGYGVQVFGMEGAKLASIFDDNMKSGAGILVCGDGTTIERKPLFIMNNPTQKRASISHSQMFPLSMPNSFRLQRPGRGSSATRMKSILNMMIREAFPDKEIIEHQKFNDTFPMVDMVSWPIAIPLHATAVDINVGYHVRKLIPFYQPDPPPKQAQFVLSSKDSKASTRDSPIGSIILNEMRLLSRVVALKYVYLKEVYSKYCTLNPLEKFCAEYHKPVMSRLHLWQFLRDMDIHNFKISLYDVDMMMLDIPNIHLESEHNPHENIYFWQFIHCLMLLSYQAYFTNEFFMETKSEGTYQALFHKFIDEVIVPNEGKFQGRCLFNYRDLLPIKAVHGLYKSIGDPHTARTLLNRICNRVGEEPLSCKIKRKKVYNVTTPHKHYVINGSKLVYMPVRKKADWEPNDPKVLNKYASDPFYTDLRVFRVLGAKQVVECICNICPNVKEGKDVVFIDHYITFLEFYEILINLAIALKIYKENLEEIEASELEVESVNKRKKSNPKAKDEASQPSKSPRKKTKSFNKTD